jgi:hypothetical protein
MSFVAIDRKHVMGTGLATPTALRTNLEELGLTGLRAGFSQSEDDPAAAEPKPGP